MDLKELKTTGDVALFMSQFPPNTPLFVAADGEGNRYVTLSNGVDEDSAKGKVLLFPFNEVAPHELGLA